jgi:glucokinase
MSLVEPRADKRSKTTTEIVAADIGGTHARFGIATLDAGRVVDVTSVQTLHTADYASLQTAWQAFGEMTGRPLPRQAGIAVACPVTGEVLKMTNNPWVIRPALIPRQLGLDRFTLVNDFGAIGHAVAHSRPEDFVHLCGPSDSPLDAKVTTLLGPGTGLGVAQLTRESERYHVVETEGGHIAYAPLDSIEDAILGFLRPKYGRVSIERVVSGPGLANIYAALAALEGRPIHIEDDKALWTAALKQTDPLAAAALDRFCLSLGSVAGDLALAQGAQAVVIAGGVGLRLADHLPKGPFRQRFIGKGRFERMMSAIPVRLLVRSEPGLFGAAAAFAADRAK